MIKGIDAQVMTQRTSEYTKDVSVLLRRDELSREFADRMQRSDAEQELHTVTQMEQLEHKRINPDDDSGSGHGGQQKEDGGESRSASALQQQAEGQQKLSIEERMANGDFEALSAGVNPVIPLLDIEI